MNQDIIDFLKGEKRASHESLTLLQMLAKRDDQLETAHDFVQWLFPTPEKSNFNLSAPVLDEETAKVVKEQALGQKVLESYGRFLRFYDLTVLGNAEVAFKDSLPLNHPRRWWCKPNDHNHLRLTRIIRCLKLLGYSEQASALYGFLKGTYAKWAGNFATLETVQWWKKAAERESWEPMR